MSPIVYTSLIICTRIIQVLQLFVEGIVFFVDDLGPDFLQKRVIESFDEMSVLHVTTEKFGLLNDLIPPSISLAIGRIRIHGMVILRRLRS